MTVARIDGVGAAWKTRRSGIRGAGGATALRVRVVVVSVVLLVPVLLLVPFAFSVASRNSSSESEDVYPGNKSMLISQDGWIFIASDF